MARLNTYSVKRLGEFRRSFPSSADVWLEIILEYILELNEEGTGGGNELVS